MAQRSDTTDGESSAPPSTGVEPIQAWTSSATPSIDQKMLNLCRPSSKTSGPPPLRSRSKRHSAARAGTSQPQAGSPERLFWRMESTSPISPRAHDLHQPGHGRVEEEVLEDAHDLPARRGRVGSLHEALAFGHRETDRLLDGEVLAGREGRQGHLQVHVVGEEHLEGVDRVVRQAVLPVGVDLLRLDAPAPRPRQRARRVRFADSRDLGVRRVHVLDGVQVADATRPDDGDPHALDGCGHGNPLLGWLDDILVPPAAGATTARRLIDRELLLH